LRPSFGTDGVRGRANAELTPELVLALGRAAARRLGPGPMLVGRDTRRSGPMLQAALTAGLASEGMDVVDLGVLPTPGVAFLSQRRDQPAAMISASHNPFADNGVKFFLAGGRKLPVQVEAGLEAELAGILEDRDRDHDRDRGHPGAARPEGRGVGGAGPEPGAAEEYTRHLVSTVPAGSGLGGLSVVIDCAHGAASALAAGVFRQAGAEVLVLSAQPDGCNINDRCGSTFPQRLQAAVVEAGADAGLALDGDADRVVAVDHLGHLVDGDHLIAICAIDLRDLGRLRDDTVVVTVMANLGFRLGMRAAGIAVHETPVGDRAVLEALAAGHWSLGGEQSGHVIFSDLATTGDGMLTGLQLLEVMARRGRPLAELAASSMTRLPQVLRSVRVARPSQLEGAAALWDAVRDVEAELAGQGRVLLRASGTEPVVRVMVEAATEEHAARAADRLADLVARALGEDPAPLA